MRKTIVFCLLLVGTAAVILSCSPDDEPHNPNMKWKTQPATSIIEMIVVGAIVCPNEGKNCEVRSGLFCPTTPQQRIMRDSFLYVYRTNYHERGLLPFLNRHEWAEIFPEVDLSTQIVRRVKDGTYGIFVSDSDDALVVTTTPTGEMFGEEHVVAAYKQLPDTGCQ